MITTRTVTKKSVKNIYHSSNGGFIIYAKLTFQIWKQANSISSSLNLFTIFNLYTKLFFKSIWWIFIKPFASIFSSSVKIEGNFESVNYQIPKNHNLSKVVIIKIFKIPVFFYPSNLTAEDWQQLLK